MENKTTFDLLDRAADIKYRCECSVYLLEEIDGPGPDLTPYLRPEVVDKLDLSDPKRRAFRSLLGDLLDAMQSDLNLLYDGIRALHMETVEENAAQAPQSEKSTEARGDR